AGRVHPAHAADHPVGRRLGLTAMFSVTEAQLLAWLNPLLWPFIRTLALFAGMPTFSQRNVPLRLRIGLSLFIA
ncbi:flagellar biosynthetic protein FliR, partial [Klebsiella oxytoca]|uniref:flagellar biosynthetic protein FliR n=1 Tax=Klebsiella oxytoca TaxID=571 RepID=UPI0019534623